MCSTPTAWSATDARQSLSQPELRKLGVMMENLISYRSCPRLRCSFRNSVLKMPLSAKVISPGDASGTQNPLSLTMTQSKVVNANFTGSASVQVDRAKGDGLTSAGFRFSILSDPQLAWQVRVSSNLTSWQGLGTATNSSTEVQFTDPDALTSARRFYQVLPET